ncbi:MAG TPA: hypothetical protein VGL58_14170 [Caulobacteraceae bacterium]|jgi:hypothetical protein
MKLGGKIALGAAALMLATAGGYVVGYSDQPHMHAAQDDLRAARGELQSATSDKGGHRVRAIALVNQALSEVQAGLDCARGDCM